MAVIPLMEFHFYLLVLAGSFLGLGASGIEKQESISSGAGSELVYENEHAATYTDTADFDEVLDNIGAAEVFDE